MTNTETITILCEGCREPLSIMDQMITDRRVCMPCTKARHKAAMTHRCSCGKQKRPSEVHGLPRQRQWISCLRCLGTIEQVN